MKNVLSYFEKSQSSSQTKRFMHGLVPNIFETCECLANTCLHMVANFAYMLNIHTVSKSLHVNGAYMCDKTERLGMLKDRKSLVKVSDGCFTIDVGDFVIPFCIAKGLVLRVCGSFLKYDDFLLLWTVPPLPADLRKKTEDGVSN